MYRIHEGSAEIARLLRKAADLIESGDMDGELEIQADCAYAFDPGSWTEPYSQIMRKQQSTFRWKFTATGNNKAEP